MRHFDGGVEGVLQVPPNVESHVSTLGRDPFKVILYLLSTGSRIFFLAVGADGSSATMGLDSSVQTYIEHLHWGLILLKVPQLFLHGTAVTTESRIAPCDDRPISQDGGKSSL